MIRQSWTVSWRRDHIPVLVRPFRIDSNPAASPSTLAVRGTSGPRTTLRRSSDSEGVGHRDTESESEMGMHMLKYRVWVPRIGRTRRVVLRTESASMPRVRTSERRLCSRDD